MTMASAYDFDAPQFLDLREVETTELEKYFDLQEAGISSLDDAATGLAKSRVTFCVNDENKDPQYSKYSLGSRIQTPGAKSVKKDSILDDDLLAGIGKLGIGSSNNTTKVHCGRTPLRTTQVFEGIQLEPVSAKKHSMVTRTDILRTPKLSLRSRDIPKPIEPDSSDDNDDSMVTAVSTTTKYFPPRELKRRSNQRPDYTAPNEHDAAKFVALAEQVANFQNETPDRYRTKPHNPWRPSMKPPMRYIPKTPSLAAVHRKRTVYFPDRDEREQNEYEEMMKHQIKAYPINAKILKQPSLGLKMPVEKRPPTLPQPFKLTELKPKPIVEAPLFQFKAQPVPRKILQSPVGIPPKMVRPVTTPKTPHITMPIKHRVNSVSVESQCSGGSADSLHRITKVEPFSFEIRDKMMRARKEEHIKQILEDEKKQFKAFKAQPIRAFSQMTPLKKSDTEPRKTIVKPFNLTKPQEKKQPEVLAVAFKAKPASVLKQRPFCPAHPQHATPRMAEFNLKTAERAEDRKKFDELLKKQEEEYRKAIEEQRLEKERQDKELEKKLRQQAEFKANPIPKMKPFEVRPTEAKLTEPQSPRFLSGKSKKPE